MVANNAATAAAPKFGGFTKGFSGAREMKLKIAGVVTAIGVGIALLMSFLNAKHTEVAQTSAATEIGQPSSHSTTIAEPAPVSAPASRRAEMPRPADPLSAAGVDAVLLHALQGHGVATTPEYRQFLDAAVANQSRALEVFKAAFDGIPDDEIYQRTALFAVMLEVALAIKAQDPGNLSAFVRGELPLIRAQTGVAPRVPVARQDLSSAQIQELLHIGGGYALNDGQLYALTLQPKLMSVAVLKHAGTPEAAEYLTQIGQDSSVDSVVRQTAAVHASQLAGQTPGKR
jgi:hypothetical protein